MISIFRILHPTFFIFLRFFLNLLAFFFSTADDHRRPLLNVNLVDLSEFPAPPAESHLFFDECLRDVFSLMSFLSFFPLLLLFFFLYPFDLISLLLLSFSLKSLFFFSNFPHFLELLLSLHE